MNCDHDFVNDDGIWHHESCWQLEKELVEEMQLEI